MPTTPTLELCDDLVAALVAAWAPTAPSGAERAYFKRITDEDEARTLAESLRLADGERRVVVFPVGYSSAYANDAEDAYSHEVQTLIVERYAAAGDPTRDWIDERVDWVHEQIFQGWDFRASPSWNTYLRTISADVLVCDLSKLVTNKLFWSVVGHTFEEHRSIS